MNLIGLTGLLCKWNFKLFSGKFPRRFASHTKCAFRNFSYNPMSCKSRRKYFLFSQGKDLWSQTTKIEFKLPPFSSIYSCTCKSRISKSLEYFLMYTCWMLTRIFYIATKYCSPQELTTWNRTKHSVVAALLLF